MKRRLLHRVLGIVLAGVLLVESGMTSLAANGGSVNGITVGNVTTSGGETDGTGSLQGEAGNADITRSVGEAGSIGQTDNLEAETDTPQPPAEETEAGQPDAADDTEGTVSENETSSVEDGMITEAPTVSGAEPVENGAADGTDGTADTTEESDLPDVTDDAASLTGIAFQEQPKTSMLIGETQTLSIVYDPADTTADKTVTWTSSEPDIIAVTPSGDDNVTATLEAKAVGEAVITATVTTVDGDKTAACTITVTDIDLPEKPLTEITLNKTELTLIKGTSDADTLEVSYHPADTDDNTTVTWTTSADDIVAVNPSLENSVTATIEAVAGGTADITATVTTAAGEQITAHCTVTVRIPAESIVLSETELALLRSESKDITVTVLPADATDTISVTAKDSGYVNYTVNGNQLSITAGVTLGETELTIAAGSKKAVLPVRIVMEKEDNDGTTALVPVNSVVIDKTKLENTENDANGSMQLKLGDAAVTETLTATVLPANANQTLTWTSSNESVAKVAVSETDGTVTVTAVGVGNAAITATADNGVSDSVHVVVAPAAYDVYMTSANKAVLYCNADKLAADIDTKNINKTHPITMVDSNLTYEYYSSDREVATVNADGLVTAVAPGKATITALNRASGKAATMSVEVRRLVESIELPLIPSGRINVVKGSETALHFSLEPEKVHPASLKYTKVEVQSVKGAITVVNDYQNKASGDIRFRANDLVSGATLTVTAGDTYTNAYGTEVTVISARAVLTVNVVAATGTKVGSIKLTGTSKMKSDTTQSLETIVRDTKGDDMAAGVVSLGYASSDEKVATVDAFGKVTALKGGSVTITAYALDGSNKKATYKITVEQRPKEIVFDRAVYGVTQSKSGTASVTLKPSFLPTTVASKQKGVTWEISGVTKTDGSRITDAASISTYFTVSTGGKVSVKKAAESGMKATVVCTSKAYETGETPVTGTVTVQVQPKKVSAVKFQTPSAAVTGLGEHALAFTTTLADSMADMKPEDYKATTSDAQIATVKSVENGKVVVEAHTYGTVTITVCADNAVTASCKVTIYPTDKGKFEAKQSEYLIQQAQFDANDKAVLQFVDSKTKKEVINPLLLTYESSNPDIVYVDEKGFAYANPDAKITAKNAKVTITATLKDDPDKRSAKTTVTVCEKNQIARMDVTYYPTVEDATGDVANTKGKPLASGTTMAWTAGQEFVLRVTAYDAVGNRLENPQITYTTSDSDIAYIKPQGLKSFTGDNKKNYTWQVVVRAVKAGKFSLTATAKDQTKTARKLTFGAYDGTPVLASDGLGTIHKNGKETPYGKYQIVAAQTPFTIYGANGTDIITDVNGNGVSVKEAVTIQVKNAKNQLVSKKLSPASFVVKAQGNDKYLLYIDNAALKDAAAGEYQIKLSMQRSALLPEESESGPGTAPSKEGIITTTFKIAEDMPLLKDARVTLNTFIKGDAVKLPFAKDLKIDRILIPGELALSDDIDLYEDGSEWYVRIKDSKFDTWTKTATSGTVRVYLEGYQNPVDMRLFVTAKAMKPVVKQQAVPSIQLRHGTQANVVLVDAKKNVWKDYSVSLKNETTARFTLEAKPDYTEVTVKDSSLSSSTTVREKVLVQKPEWRAPIELSLSVKAYNGATTVPKVTFAQASLTMNRGVGETSARTDVKVSYSNVELTEKTNASADAWIIPDTYKYTKKIDNKKVKAPIAELFDVTYTDGTVMVSMKNGIDVPNGTYTFRMTRLWDADNDAALKTPLTTANLKVTVRDTVPTVSVKMSGKLDLINRRNSTLQGTVTVKYMNSTVQTIALQDEFADDYYIIQKDNTFTLYAAKDAQLKTASTTVALLITMSNGTKLTKAVSFKPVQSTPKVSTPKPLTIYKAAAYQTVDYDFNEDMTKGVRISNITSTKLPEGFRLQQSNGHLFVTLEDKALKAGTYNISVNLYISGAQAVTDNKNGKPVPKTISVIVKE